LKICVIGGGSTYTPELIKGFIERIAMLPLSELCLMDIDAHRLEIVGGFARRIVAARGSPFEIILSSNHQEAIAGASYVITQLRVGQMEARRADEYLGFRHGLVGQETTGVGGMAKALRTIPVILEIAAEMRKSAASGALLVNFTNPSGVITQALADHAPDVPAVGVCNAPFTMKMGLLELVSRRLGITIDPSRAELDNLGLNHLTWQRGFRLDGEEIWPQVLSAYVEELKHSAEPEWEPERIEASGLIPNYYLQYFYHTAHKLEEQKNWPPSRAEEVIEVEKTLLEKYANPGLVEPPEELLKRGGAYYSTVATQLLNAHYNNLGEIHIANSRNGKAVPEWPENWVLELPCRVDANGVQPLPAEPLPAGPFEIISQVKMYELLTVQAAVHGDWEAARQALLANPLGPQPAQVHAVLEDMLTTHRQYLPRFWR